MKRVEVGLTNRNEISRTVSDVKRRGAQRGSTSPAEVWGDVQNNWGKFMDVVNEREDYEELLEKYNEIHDDFTNKWLNEGDDDSC